MSKITSIQLSAFIDKTIEPNPDNIVTLMNEINSLNRGQFLPNITNSHDIDMMSGTVSISQNLHFFTVENEKQVIFQKNRIDVVVNASHQSYLNLDNELDFEIKALEGIMNNQGVSANRLAVNLTLVENFNPSKGKIIALMRDASLFKGSNIKEWTTQTNTENVITLHGCSEILNTITELKLIRNDEAQDNILCHFDINTLHSERNYRFTFESIKPFVDAINPLISDAINSFEGVREDEQ